MYIYISHVNVTQTVPDISPLMPMHQDPLLVYDYMKTAKIHLTNWQFYLPQAAVDTLSAASSNLSTCTVLVLSKYYELYIFVNSL